MPAKKKTADVLPALVRHYRASIEPVDLADFFEIAERLGGQSPVACFETLVEQEKRRRPGMTADEYIKACEDVHAALPALASLRMKMSDYEANDQAARTDVAFRIGVEIGKALAGGAR